MHTVIKYEPPKYLLILLQDAHEKEKAQNEAQGQGAPKAAPAPRCSRCPRSVRRFFFPDQRDVAQMDQDVNAMIKLIYENSSSEQEVKEIRERILSTCSKTTSNCTIRDAFQNPMYKNGTWIALGVMFWHEAVGMNAIMLYSNTMLKEMSDGVADPAITPKVGTYIIGFVTLFSSALSIWVAKTFDRKKIFVCGHIAIGVFHVLVGVFSKLGYSIATLACMCGFMAVMQCSSGCITWLYCSEVAVDVVLGFVGFTGYFIIFILTLTTQFMMQPNALTPSGTFWMFGSISFFAAAWFQVYLKETKPLNDKQKKMLYVP